MKVKIQTDSACICMAGALPTRSTGRPSFAILVGGY